jgi:hypothetical protein
VVKYDGFGTFSFAVVVHVCFVVFWGMYANCHCRSNILYTLPDEHSDRVGVIVNVIPRGDHDNNQCE